MLVLSVKNAAPKLFRELIKKKEETKTHTGIWIVQMKNVEIYLISVIAFAQNVEAPVREIKMTDNFSVEFMKALELVQNGIYDIFYETGRLNIEDIEKIIIKEFRNIMTQKELADFLGTSERTIRNKAKQYGLRNIQENVLFLH